MPNLASRKWLMTFLIFPDVLRRVNSEMTCIAFPKASGVILPCSLLVNILLDQK